MSFLGAVYRAIKNTWKDKTRIEQSRLYQSLNFLMHIGVPIISGFFLGGPFAAIALCAVEGLKFFAPSGLWWFGSHLDAWFQKRVDRGPSWLKTAYFIFSWSIQQGFWGLSLVPQVVEGLTSPLKRCLGLALGFSAFALTRCFTENETLQILSYFFMRYGTVHIYDNYRALETAWTNDLEEGVQVWRAIPKASWLGNVIEEGHSRGNAVKRFLKPERLAQWVTWGQAALWPFLSTFSKAASKYMRAPEILKTASKYMRAPEILKAASKYMRIPAILKAASKYVRVPKIPEAISKYVKFPEIPGGFSKDMRVCEILEAASNDRRVPKILEAVSAYTRPYQEVLGDVQERLERGLLDFFVPETTYHQVRTIHFQRVHYEEKYRGWMKKKQCADKARQLLEERQGSFYGIEHQVKAKAVAEAKKKIVCIEKALSEFQEQHPTGSFEKTRALQVEYAALSAKKVKMQKEYACLQKDYQKMIEKQQHIPELQALHKQWDVAHRKERVAREISKAAQTDYSRNFHKTPLGVKKILLGKIGDKLLEKDVKTEQSRNAVKAYQKAKAELLAQGSSHYGVHVKQQCLPVECRYEQAYMQFIEKQLQQDGYRLDHLKLEKERAQSRLNRLIHPENIVDSKSFVRQVYSTNRSAEDVSRELVDRLAKMGYLEDDASKMQARGYLQQAYGVRADREHQLALRIDVIKGWNRTPAIQK